MSAPPKAPLSGLGNHFSTEAVPGALPQGRNSPQRPPLGLYPELLSGSAFTAPRHDNRRTWLYRRLPSVVVGGFSAVGPTPWLSGGAQGVVVGPNPMRWGALPLEADGPHDFLEGLFTVAVNGDIEAHTGLSIHVYRAHRSMQRSALANFDGEMLLVPQEGRLRLVTEMGTMEVGPLEVALIPRGLLFRVEVEGPCRGYVCENHGAPFRLPELGPIGSNGLASPRDFLSPQAAPEADDGPHTLYRRQSGALWRGTSPHNPFNVVAWHGNLAPWTYDTRHFMVIGSISFDHPDPSIFTFLTSPSDTPGTANADVVLFPPRWMVAEDTFRPPWFHRNLMSEFMGLVQGQYDAKPGGFVPGGMSLHNSMVPHGPDAQAHAQATQAQLQPHKLQHTLAFMFESRYRLWPTAQALQHPALDTAYADCWQGLTPAPMA